jgi:amino acid transporter
MVFFISETLLRPVIQAYHDVLGLFLGSGRSIAAVGPGGAVVCYVLMGTVISSVISCVGEMTALMPVNAPMMEFPRRFVDRGVGFAVGWMYWYGITHETEHIRLDYADYLPKVCLCGHGIRSAGCYLECHQVPL